MVRRRWWLVTEPTTVAGAVSSRRPFITDRSATTCRSSPTMLTPSSIAGSRDSYSTYTTHYVQRSCGALPNVFLAPASQTMPIFLVSNFNPLLALTHRPPQVMRIQQWIGTPGWRRAMAARARIDDFVDSQVADARIHPRPDDHLLATLINSCPADGQPLAHNEIRDLVVSLIAAGYETTSGALAWAIYALLNVPDAWDSAAAEVGRVLGSGLPTAQNIGALTYLNGVVQETLRLYSPGVISARKAKRDLQFDGHQIRAGRLLIFSPYVTHRISDIWAEPEEFRPERWDPDSSHYRRPAPHEFIPFSAGLHRCVGSAMAITELTVMLARLVARTTLRLPAQRIGARNFAALRPWPGLTVEVEQIATRYQRRDGGPSN